MPDINAEWHIMETLIEDLKEKGLNREDTTKSNPPDPDFLIKVKEETIGVEVTQFSAQDNQFKSNGDVDTALDRGKEIFHKFYKGNCPALYVRVYFFREPEKADQAKDIGEGLAHVVQTMYNKKIMDSNAGRDEDLFCGHGLLDNVSRIHFDWSVDGKDELWDSPRYAWGPTTVSAEDIQEIINKKNKKLSGYRKNCKSMWLAIYNCLEAGFYGISDEAIQFSYTRGFDRIFWVEMGRGNPISLNDPILPAIRENMPKSRTDVFKVYELRMVSEN